MNDVTNPIREAIINSIELPEINDERVYLSEAEFRNKWLNVFIGYFIGDSNAPINRWIDTVSGNHYKEVHVVSNIHNPEETLQFIVPPIFSRDENIYNVNEDDMDVNTVLNMANLNNKNFPGSGNTLIEQGIIAKIKDTTPSMVETERWRAIYEYYNIEAPFVTDKPRGVSNASNSQTSEVVGFDDDF